MNADLLQFDVPPGSRLAGVHIDELRLPVGAAVTLVLRDGSGFVPGPDTRLRTGDALLIVATAGGPGRGGAAAARGQPAGAAGPMVRRVGLTT